jgi:hypothetical protein
MADNTKKKEYNQTVRNFLVHDGELIPFGEVRTKDAKKIDEEVRRKGLENDALEQDTKLKKITLVILFIFLGAETVAVFAFAYLQAMEWNGFGLEEWSFKLLVSATLLQITYMLQVAVKHLFPTKHA